MNKLNDKNASLKMDIYLEMCSKLRKYFSYTEKALIQKKYTLHSNSDIY